ncbi:hypothetical protein FDP41_004434 [Naegleria fowleri]|uniref:Core Histone H2A/H2B/H3 domain-containing protein n=1 Tax=Naegleria fowleri TaxID=5763 RepID=A0A6A5BT17_NAEFO|nr:uncharacterized protein FDP41_004434 [Naegleria fowleri]KAF0976535.1 hypothetical protein FDP41_004434 [Naegleria fowleri]
MSREQSGRSSSQASDVVIVIDDDDDPVQDEDDTSSDEAFGMSDHDLQRSQQALRSSLTSSFPMSSGSLGNDGSITSGSSRPVSMMARRSIPFSEQEKRQSSSSSQQRLPLVAVPRSPAVQASSSQQQTSTTFSLSNPVQQSSSQVSSRTTNVQSNLINRNNNVPNRITRDSQRSIDHSLDTQRSPVVGSSSNNNWTENSDQQPRPTRASRPTTRNISTKRTRRTLWLKEIMKYQRSTELLIPRLPFQRVVREIGLKVANDRGCGLLWK